MQWSDERNAGFSAAVEESLYLPIIRSDQFSYHKINVAAQKDSPDSLFNSIRDLISIRKNNPVLAEGDYEIIPIPTKPALLCIKRWNSRGTIIAIHNLSDQSLQVDLRHHLDQEDILYNLVGKESCQHDSCQLRPFSYQWLKVERKMDR